VSTGDYLQDIADRHEGLLDEATRDQLAKAVICGAGAGGVGGNTYVALARMGCRHFRIADCGDFDASNANRQMGCTAKTVGRNKAEVVAGLVRDIQPEADVTVYPEGVTDDNLRKFIEGGTLVIDGIDLYALRIKRALYETARAAGLPVLSCPIFGFGAAVAVFDPVRSPSFGDYFGPLPDPEDTMAYRRYLQRIGMGFFGFVPRLDWPIFVRRVYEGKCPSIATSCMLAGALGAVAVVDYVCGDRSFPVIPETVHVDLRQMRILRAGRFRRFLFKLHLLWTLRHCKRPGE
jgi:molybdopterin/thiamine biosynthesis adenylyltransferase